MWRRHGKEPAMRYTIRILMGIGAAIILTWFSFVTTANNGHNTWASTLISHASKMNIVASPTSTPAISSGNGLGFDPAIIAAFIGLGGVVLGALIAGGVALFQTRRMSQLQREQ